MYCSICGENYDDSNCCNVVHVQHVNNFNHLPQNNSYSSIYNPGWKYHPNLGWRDQPKQNYPTNQPSFPSRQIPIESQTAWEIVLEKHVQGTNDRFENVQRTMNQMMSIIRNMEVQMGQFSMPLTLGNRENYLVRPQLTLKSISMPSL